MRREIIEAVVARWFDVRHKLIVPNISWGMRMHECDLLIVTKRGRVSEVEIKVSRSDLRRDQKKWHQHRDSRIGELWFAMPIDMADCAAAVPETAGILLVHPDEWIKVVRRPVARLDVRPLTEKERHHIAELGNMRTWDLRSKIARLVSTIELQKVELGVDRYRWSRRARKDWHEAAYGGA